VDNKAKMSGHSRAAIAAGDTIRAVIDQMNDAPFMRERTSERTERDHRRAEAARDVVGDATTSILARIGREMEHTDGI
jgi:hypothetical protein